MNRRSSSVRIGPISLFSLAVILCMAVMSVLSVTTANASYITAQKQATFASDTYANESAAQEILARIDAALEPVRKSSGGLNASIAAVQAVLPAGSVQNDRVQMTFTAQSGRTLEIVLTLRSNATYEISAWKATTKWSGSDTGESLWSGASKKG